jgi:uncharacterized phage protein gp47/JayE
MTTPTQYSQQMLATLANTMPTLSCEVGTPERKIVDAVAECISEASVAQYLVGSLLDIDTKSGAELEQFVGIFGFGRLQGQAATGVVRVTVTMPSTQDYTFQLGTQFYTTPGLAGMITTLYFASTQAVVLTTGNLNCDVPVQCTVVGSTGNVPPNSITYVGDVIGGSTVTNLGAMTGGVDPETDAELRQRFKDTLLRNMAGTSDYYEALCQQNNNVSRVAVYGPLSLYKTQIPVPTTEVILPVNQDVKYAWPAMESVFDQLGQENETFYSPINDYIYTAGTSPQFTTISSGALVPGNIVDLEFQYTTKSSRNNPLNGICNKVDIFVDGVSPFAVTEATSVSAATLSSLTSDALYTDNFERVGSAGSPTAGNRFMRLGSVPVVSFPSTLTIGGVVYTRGTHYWLLAPNTNPGSPNPTTLLKGSAAEVAGVEWSSAGPSTGTPVTLDYVYNQVPQLLGALIAPAKQITTDVMVHQGTFAYLQPCLDIEYDRTYSVATVNSNIITRMQSFWNSMPFGVSVKLSVITMYVQQTLGVVDCKVTQSADAPLAYGIQIFNNSSDPSPAVSEVADFKLADNQLAVYQGVVLRRVATP